LHFLTEIFPNVLFFPAVIITTLLAGTRAGLLALLLSVLSSWAFYLPPDFRTLQFTLASLTIIGVTTLLRGANDRVLALNETLRVSEEKFRGLLESSPDAMVIIDSAGRIALINTRTEELFGYRRAELLGQPAEMLLSERDRAAYLDALAQMRSRKPAGKPPDL